MSNMSTIERMFTMRLRPSSHGNMRPSRSSVSNRDSSGDSTDTDLVVVSGTSAGSSPQDQACLPACRQKPEPDIGDALGMPPEYVDPDAESRSSGNDSSALGLSQVLGRILQQLSLSAWLPAAMLVGNVSVQLQLRDDGSYNIPEAVKELAGKPLGTIIILAFALVLATVVTQAFEFEIIRFLEGYPVLFNTLAQPLMRLRIRGHENRLERLSRKLATATDGARLKAVSAMRKLPGFDPEELDYIAENPARDSPKFNAELNDRTASITWKRYAPAADLYRIDTLVARYEAYPEEHRILPTQLGNVLRAAEDEIGLDDNENLEGYVIRHYEQLSPALQGQHDTYRTRLNMYCCLVLAFVLLFLLSPVTLNSVRPFWGMAIVMALYGLMAVLSYAAAIATARLYGLVLQEIPLFLGRQEEANEPVLCLIAREPSSPFSSELHATDTEALAPGTPVLRFPGSRVRHSKSATFRYLYVR
jgi:hypothetical protein